MIYLTGITIAELHSSNKTTRKFKRIKLPFNTENELESFICEMGNDLNKRVYPMTLEK